MLTLFSYESCTDKMFPVITIILVGPPSKPDPPTTISRRNEMLVRWNKPYDGGAPVEGYVLEYRSVEM